MDFPELHNQRDDFKGQSGIKLDIGAKAGEGIKSGMAEEGKGGAGKAGKGKGGGQAKSYVGKESVGQVGREVGDVVDEVEKPHGR